MRICLLLAFAASCAPTGELQWKVRDAGAVALQAVGDTGEMIWRYDLEHPVDVLPGGGPPHSELAPFRTGQTLARRNPDGSIDLVFTTFTWPIVRPDGTITSLRQDNYELRSDSAWAFLAAPPGGELRHPWQLRIATSRDNVQDARLLVRRDPLEGWALTGFGAGVAGIGATAILASDNAAMKGIGVGIVGLGALALGYGLHAFFRHEHDIVLTP